MNGIVFGYARVSTDMQTVDNQVGVLTERGVKAENIFTDVFSGAKHYSNRPRFEALLNKLRRGDTLIVYSIDRLSRRMKDVIELVERFELGGVNLVIASMQLDLTTPAGKLILHQFAALTEFELGLLKQRQKLGIERAKKEGKYKGRRSKISKLTTQTILDLHLKGFSLRKIAEVVKLGKSTVQRIVSKNCVQDIKL